MTRVQQQMLVVAIAVVAVAAGIGAAVLRSGGAEGAGAKPGASTDASGADATGPARPSQQDASAAESQQKAASSDASDAALRTWRIPAPGAYRYHYSRSGDGATDYEASFVVAAEGRNGYSDSRENDAVKSKYLYSVEGGGLRQMSFTLDTGARSDTCRWDRPVVIIPADPKDGHEWTSKAACTMDVGDKQAAIQLESTWKIVGVREAKVGDATVQLLRVDGRSNARTTTEDGTFVRTSGFITYYDPARGLRAKSTEDVTETRPSGTTSFRIVETMLTVQPEVLKK